MHSGGKVDRQHLVKFGRTGFFFFLFIGCLLWLKFRMETKTVVFFCLSVFFLICPYIAPPLMLVVFKVMTAVGGVVGWVNRTILLALVFFALITPVSFILKMIGRDPMNRKINKSAATYWTKRDPSDIPAPASYENRF